MGKQKVIYFYDDDIGNFHYGPSHPMKPHRIRMTHDLLRCYGLLSRMHVKKPFKPSVEMLTQFHSDDYVDFLRHSDSSQRQQQLLQGGGGLTGAAAADMSAAAAVPDDDGGAATAAVPPPLHAMSSSPRRFLAAAAAAAPLPLFAAAAAPLSSAAAACSRLPALPCRLPYSPLFSYSSPRLAASGSALSSAAALSAGEGGAAAAVTAEAAAGPWARKRRAAESGLKSGRGAGEAAAGAAAGATAGVALLLHSGHSSCGCGVSSRREMHEEGDRSETAGEWRGQQQQHSCTWEEQEEQQQQSLWGCDGDCCKLAFAAVSSEGGRQRSLAATTAAAAAVSGGGGGGERRDRGGELQLPWGGRVSLSSSMPDLHAKFNTGEDCPVFEGLWDYCGLYSGGSIEGARRVGAGEYDFAINWAGGLHHAKKHEASGFCYVNDCVLAAIEFLRVKHRVLYIDVDIHHGDGVEEAFYTSPRVMCCSFHKYGDYFPGTGAADDIGADDGLGYSINIPLHDGISDGMYIHLFRSVMDRIIEAYRPEAVVLQSGADSLAGDRLGCFNLSIAGHSEAAKYFREKGLPTIFLGGGGYTLRNVPRCWAYESACVLGLDICPDIPEESEYLGYYGPNQKLEIRTANMDNRNDEVYIQSLIENVSTTLKDYVFPVCAQISAGFPPEWSGDFLDLEHQQLLADAAAERKEEEEEELCMDESLDCEDLAETEFFTQKSERNRG